MEVIETKQDAIKYIQGGNNAKEIMALLENLSDLFGTEERDEEEEDA
jgi:hypothetical protein